MCTANVRVTPIAVALRMPSESISEHVASSLLKETTTGATSHYTSFVGFV